MKPQNSVETRSVVDVWVPSDDKNVFVTKQVFSWTRKDSSEIRYSQDEDGRMALDVGSLLESRFDLFT